MRQREPICGPTRDGTLSGSFLCGLTGCGKSLDVVTQAHQAYGDWRLVCLR